MAACVWYPMPNGYCISARAAMRNKIYLLLLICQILLVIEMCGGIDWLALLSSKPTDPVNKPDSKGAVKLHMQFVPPPQRYTRYTSLPMPQWQPMHQACHPQLLPADMQAPAVQMDRGRPCMKKTVRA